MYAKTLYVPIKDKHMTVHVYEFFIDNIFFNPKEIQNFNTFKRLRSNLFSVFVRVTIFGDVIIMIQDFSLKNGSVIT